MLLLVLESQIFVFPRPVFYYWATESSVTTYAIPKFSCDKLYTTPISDVKSVVCVNVIAKMINFELNCDKTNSTFLYLLLKSLLS